MIQEDAELDEMFIKVIEPPLFCSKCNCEMQNTGAEFKCQKCGAAFSENKK